MKKSLLFLEVLMLLICIFSVSCSDEQDSTGEKLVDVTLVSIVNDEKSLTVTGESALTKYSYTATPLFSSKGNGKSQGCEVKTAEKVTLSSQTFKNLSQGNWKFEVVGYNASEKKMYYGMTEENVTEDTSTVEILLGPSYETGTGTLSLSITAPKVGSKPSLSYSVSDYDGQYASASTSSTNSSDFALTDELTLSPGLHTVVITNYDDQTPVGGEIFTVKIVESDEVSVSGYIDTGSYESVAINVYEFTGTVSEDTKNKGTYIFSFNDAFDSTDVSYKWYLNGVEKETTATYTPSFSKNGYYSIVCVATYSDGTITAVASSGVYVDYEEQEAK